jgi:VanZ family protein
MRALKLKSFWLFTGGALVLTVVAASLAPLPATPVMESDKLLHIAAYAGLGAWFGAIYLRRWHAVVIGALVALGIGVEFAQTLTGYRSFEMLDIAADATGAVLGILLATTPVGGSLGWIERRLLKAA